MSHYMVYFRQYWNSEPKGQKPPTNWSTDSKEFHEILVKGDTLWVVISANNRTGKEWYLLQSIRVSTVDPLPSPTPYGKWHIFGDKKKSWNFRIVKQPDMTAILWLLEFKSGKRIKHIGKRIGQSLQSHGHRTLSEKDAVLLLEYSKAIR